MDGTHSNDYCIYNAFSLVPTFQNSCGAKSVKILYAFYHSINICPICSNCWSHDAVFEKHFHIKLTIANMKNKINIKNNFH